ncbi:hypothetical protein EA772_01930 [Pedobacter sp. G11]|uniref:multiubiquitin domain-containing protein n=1 Tax=Pedobacter sp. G11 TaxID=2482728 RepID=UPI000F5FC2D8|nr:multiubiquitin domain-containing protein [Pedobacter sp. G11]AZI24164.1 hypothetical protein EA772_01930 [Pedobacter sp. G11]
MDDLRNVQTQPGCERMLSFSVEDKPYETDQQYLTGLEIKRLAGLAKSSVLFLTVREPWKDELISDDTRVDLARPGIEGFYIKKKLDFVVNGKKFSSEKQYLTGDEIKKIAAIGEDDEIFLMIAGPYEDELILNNVRINLARPGIEKFFSKEKSSDFNIIVNAREKVWNAKEISFEQVVELAFGTYKNDPNVGYTVTYSRGWDPKPEGTMVKGSNVRVKNKMIFDVTATDKS